MGWGLALFALSLVRFAASLIFVRSPGNHTEEQ
jgi:hypothetical protein